MDNKRSIYSSFSVCVRKRVLGVFSADFLPMFYLRLTFFFLIIFLNAYCPLAFSQDNEYAYEDYYEESGEYDPDIYALAEKDYADEELVDEPVVKGSYRFNFGVSTSDFIWKEASWLERERSWRYIYGEKRYNTFDRSIYNQLQLSVDAPIDEKLSMYFKVSIDPWSFVGKSQMITLPTFYGPGPPDDDLVEDLQLKYWSNTGNLYPQNVRSNAGDTFNLPETKVSDGFAGATSVYTDWGLPGPKHRLDIPELKIDMEFKPMRDLWFDYKEDEYRAILFLYGEVDIAMSTDDPLKLVNNHIFWEASPWLNKWVPGKFYTGIGLGWENGLWQADQFLRDSQGKWLTLLRAFRLEGEFAGIYTDFMAATPLDLWDDYDDVNNVPLALRLKKEFTDQFMIGSIYTSRIGFDQDSRDAFDQAMALDTAYLINEYYALKAEAALSKTARNTNNEAYEVKNDDQAHKFVLEADIDPFDMPVKGELSYTKMGREFEPPLATYHYTKSDQQWGRHISFYRRTDDEENYRVGDSIDKDREVSAVDLKFGEFEGTDVYLNFRNVNSATDGSFVENVMRGEVAYQSSGQMLYKFLVLYHQRPDVNSVSPDISTFSAGFKYDFNEYVSLEAIVEKTNEYPEFPDYLYSYLDINPEPAYPYYYLNKTRLIFTPDKWWEIALEYTYNEFEYAATLDDFMNNAAVDIRYWLQDDLSARMVYRYSRVADWGLNGEVVGHHNLYFECIYDIDEQSRLLFQFSDLGSYIEGLGWQSAVLDTQHIVRVVYEGTF